MNTERSGFSAQEPQTNMHETDNSEDLIWIYEGCFDYSVGGCQVRISQFLIWAPN